MSSVFIQPVEASLSMKGVENPVFQHAAFFVLVKFCAVIALHALWRDDFNADVGRSIHVSGGQRMRISVQDNLYVRFARNAGSG